MFIPTSQIVTQECPGKGTVICTYVGIYKYIIMYDASYSNSGAFGLVHNGELKDLDGAVSTVAIKTIKCKH